MRFPLLVEERLALDFYTTVASPYSLVLKEALLKGAVELLKVEMPDPNGYSDAREFAEDYAAWNFLRKADFLETGADLSGSALQTFLDAEKSCAFYNERGVSPFLFHRVGPNPHTAFEQTFGAVFHTAKVKIGKVLGSFTWDKVERHFGFSGGASTRLPRRSGSPFYKLQGKPAVTRQAALLSICAIETRKGWKKARGLDLLSYEDWVDVVGGSHSTTVPKNAKTDRFICKEPCMNMFLQRGFGGFFRARLKTVGIDLDDQTVNQALCASGSIDGSLSTIDLKAASDSISLRLVQELLPGDWYEALCLVRSERTLLKKKDFPTIASVFGRNGQKFRGSSVWFPLEKVSSMGNGFTFELESLIFWALTSSVVELSGSCDTRIGVYGDDIICPTACGPRVIEVLCYAGFQTNADKTFLHGPFRESCGIHCFNGRDVSPFNVDEVVVGRHRVNWFLNTLNLWVGRVGPDQKWLRYMRRCTKLLMSSNSITWFNHVPETDGLEAGVIQRPEHARAFFSFRRSGFRKVALRAARKQHRLSGIFGCVFALSGRPDSSDSSWDDALFSDDLSFELLPVGETGYQLIRDWCPSWCHSDVAFGMTVRGFFFAPTT